MANFPSISAPASLSESVKKGIVRSAFENGQVLTRAKHTAARSTFEIAWPMISESEYQTLKTFFEGNIGTSFTWTHPVETTSHTCIFSTDTLESEYIAPGWRAVRLLIEELTPA